MQRSTVPIRCDIVLVGGGHSHVAVLKRFGMKPEPGVRLTVVARDVMTPYSGMIPGYIAGHYTRDECHIDLRRLAMFAGARLIHAPATGIDPVRREVRIEGRPPIQYDFLSIDSGSTPSPLDITGAEHALPVKPIDQLLESVIAMEQAVIEAQGRFAIVVAGAGAGGVELTLALQDRLTRLLQAAGFATDALGFTIVEAGDRILPAFNAAARRRLLRMLTRRNVVLKTGAPLAQVTPDTAILADGERLAADRTILVTSAGAPKWLADSGLPLDARGFIRVDATLRSPNFEQVFAAGDVASMDGHKLPKSGVYAVRQGPYLADNLRRAARGENPRRYTPQRQTLALISTGDKYAIAARGPWSIEGDWVWQLKDWIDRRFMDKYQTLPEMAPGGTSDDVLEEMRCGGCGAKVPAPVLRRALARVPAQTRDGLLQGLDAPDDAAVIAPPQGKLLVQTVDQFRAFVDDPYLFGKIAANHCLGDVFAMGAEAHSALAAVMLPHGPEEKVAEDLYQILAGATEVLATAGAALAGGHTGEAMETAFGLTVNGFADPDTILRKSGLEAGDALILTKPLGTGALFAADMQGKARGDWVEAALAAMQQSAAPAVPVLRAHEVCACTDVTGFGLAGHLGEMLTASNCDAELDARAVPALAGAREVLAQGLASTLAPANEDTARQLLVASKAEPLLFDPQTAGGLLFGAAAARAEACLDALHAAGFDQAAIIGRVTPREGAAASVIIG